MHLATALDMASMGAVRRIQNQAADVKAMQVKRVIAELISKLFPTSCPNGIQSTAKTFSFLERTRMNLTAIRIAKFSVGQAG